MAKGFDQALVKHVNDLSRRTSEIAKRRNRYVHDAWFLETKKGDVARFESLTPLTKGDYGFRTIEDSEIESDLTAITKKIEQIMELRKLLANKPKTSDSGAHDRRS
jgi:hypothetical protein